MYHLGFIWRIYSERHSLRFSLTDANDLKYIFNLDLTVDLKIL
nr:Putative uncharacterized protein [Moritella viscosa]SHO08246.1 Putative uncharacterized protein [Moritella viscosa]SHO12563.1 Putative uncharacterized protein [Moritella viscosa]SHO16303.1 Putative uncharacterized protein [Moritella viscosa]